MSEEKKPYVLSDNATLDDIDDLPEFKAWPTGAYIVTLTEGFEAKVINEHPARELKMELKEVQEIKPEDLNEGEEQPKPGDVCSTLFLLDNETGAGFLKAAAKPLAEFLGTKSLSEIFTKTKGMVCLVMLKREYKKDKVTKKVDMDTSYVRIKAISPL